MGIFAGSDTRQREESVEVIHQVLEGLRGENRRYWSTGSKR